MDDLRGRVASCPGHVPACHHGEGSIACDPCIDARAKRGPIFCPDDEECGGPGCMDHLSSGRAPTGPTCAECGAPIRVEVDLHVCSRCEAGRRVTTPDVLMHRASLRERWQMARTVTKAVRKIAATPGTKVRLHWVTVRMVLRPSTQATYRKVER